MSPEEFEKAVDRLMDLIEADGCSAVLTEQTVSIDLHGDQVVRLTEALELMQSLLDDAVKAAVRRETVRDAMRSATIVVNYDEWPRLYVLEVTR